MKKTTSFHLEEDILKEIEKYKEEYKLSSRNVAIERMLLERRNLINLQELFLNKEVVPVVAPLEAVIYPKLEKSIDANYDTMAD